MSRRFPQADRRSDQVSSLGETRLIETLKRWLGDTAPPSPRGPGDDAAVLPRPASRLVVTVDPVIYGLHFDDALPPRRAGAKLLLRNLSDLAAMGARPQTAILALALDRRTDMAWLRGFIRGLASEARRFNVQVCGGDVAEAPDFFGAWLTLHGLPARRRVILRTGARTGDWIFVTGKLGGAGLGKHHRFTPRLEEGAWLAGRPEVKSALDVSDGLAKDLFALAPKGGWPEIPIDNLPVARAARLLAGRTGREAWHHAVGDGEDYELLFCMDGATDPDAFQRRWRRRFRTPLTLLGRWVDQKPTAKSFVSWDEQHGYVHLGST